MVTLDFSFGFWDAVLVLVVAGQTTALAYLSDSRWKTLALSLPFPFTALVLSSGHPLDASHVFSLVVLFVYVLCVLVCYAHLKVPIVPSIVLGILIYTVLGGLLADVFPRSETMFWATALGVFALGLGLQILVPQPKAPSFRTPLPLWQKLPIIFAIVGMLVLIKNSLHGFAVLYPLLSTVGAYEVRHNLWILVRPVPVLMCALTLLMAIVHVTQDFVGLSGGLALGWAAFLPALLWINRHMWRPRLTKAT